MKQPGSRGQAAPADAGTKADVDQGIELVDADQGPWGGDINQAICPGHPSDNGMEMSRPGASPLIADMAVTCEVGGGTRIRSGKYLRK